MSLSVTVEGETGERFTRIWDSDDTIDQVLEAAKSFFKSNTISEKFGNDLKSKSSSPKTSPRDKHRKLSPRSTSPKQTEVSFALFREKNASKHDPLTGRSTLVNADVSHGTVLYILPIQQNNDNNNNSLKSLEKSSKKKNDGFFRRFLPMSPSARRRKFQLFGAKLDPNANPPLSPIIIELFETLENELDEGDSFVFDTTTNAAQVRAWRTAIDRDNALPQLCDDVHLARALIIEYIESLPEPILPNKQMKALLACHAHQVMKIRQILSELSTPNFLLLSKLIQHCFQLLSLQSRNGYTLTDIGNAYLRLVFPLNKSKKGSQATHIHSRALFESIVTNYRSIFKFAARSKDEPSSDKSLTSSLSHSHVDQSTASTTLKTADSKAAASLSKAKSTRRGVSKVERPSMELGERLCITVTHVALVEQNGRELSGSLWLTNFRLIFRCPVVDATNSVAGFTSTVVPLTSIAFVDFKPDRGGGGGVFGRIMRGRAKTRVRGATELPNPKRLQLICKDFRVFKLHFAHAEQLRAVRTYVQFGAFPKSIEYTFAYQRLVAIEMRFAAKYGNRSRAETSKEALQNSTDTVRNRAATSKTASAPAQDSKRKEFYNPWRQFDAGVALATDVSIANNARQAAINTPMLRTAAMGHVCEAVAATVPLPLWRLSSCNRQFSMCGTYPERLAVPASVDDTDVFRDSQLCDGGRVPMLLALFASGASLLACGQCATPSRLATVRAYLDTNASKNHHLVVVNLPNVSRAVATSLTDADWSATDESSLTPSTRSMLDDSDSDDDDDDDDDEQDMQEYSNLPLPQPPADTSLMKVVPKSESPLRRAISGDRNPTELKKRSSEGRLSPEYRSQNSSSPLSKISTNFLRSKSDSGRKSRSLQQQRQRPVRSRSPANNISKRRDSRSLSPARRRIARPTATSSTRQLPQARSTSPDTKAGRSRSKTTGGSRVRNRSPRSDRISELSVGSTLSSAFVRSAFAAMQEAVNEHGMDNESSTSWRARVEGSHWLSLLSNVLLLSLQLSDSLSSGQGVLLNGNDEIRHVLSSLIEILMSPNARTILGFGALVRKHWSALGYAWAGPQAAAIAAKEEGNAVNAHNNSVNSTATTNSNNPNVNTMALRPVHCAAFVLFIDAVHQLYENCPSQFEFDERYLLCLLDNVYSSKFGSFLGASMQHSVAEGLAKKTMCFWAWMERHAKEYTNCLFVESADLGTLLEYENYLKESSAEREEPWYKYVMMAALPSGMGLRRGTEGETLSSSGKSIHARLMTRNRAMSDAGARTGMRSHVAARRMPTGTATADDALPRGKTTLGVVSSANVLANAQHLTKAQRSLSDAGRVKVPPLNLSGAGKRVVQQRRRQTIDEEETKPLDRQPTQLSFMLRPNSRQASLQGTLTSSNPLPVRDKPNGAKTSPFVRRRQPTGGSAIHSKTTSSALVESSKPNTAPDSVMRASTVFSVLTADDELSSDDNDNDKKNNNNNSNNNNKNENDTRTSNSDTNTRNTTVVLNKPVTPESIAAVAAVARLCVLPSSLQPKALVPWNGYFLRAHSLLATRRLASPFARLPGPADTARTSLNLSSIGLASLPSEDVSSYASLRTLDLGANQLVTAPKGVALLPALETLSLRNNELQTLSPSWLKMVGERCARLRVLVLAQNQLASIPPQIACLTALNKLNLADNSLSLLPATLAALPALQHFNVSGNRLTPTAALALGHATRLTSLDLSRNALSAVAPLAAFTALRLLDLSDNLLRSVPPSVGALCCLESLSMQRNQITSLPDEIGQLTRLKALDVSNNRIGRITGRIYRMGALRRLYAQHNWLHALPHGAARLTSLEALSLADNRLVDLPPALGALTALRELNLDNNPTLMSPPRDIVAKGIVEIKKYLGTLLQQTEPLLRLKLMVLGNAGVGKSLLTKSLQATSLPVSPRTATNKLSIDISQWDVDLTTFGSVSLQCWDFASNDVQAEALQMFLTERAIYVVAFDVRARDAFEQCNAWCSVIFSRAPQAWIFLAGTHADTMPFADAQAAVKAVYMRTKQSARYADSLRGAYSIGCATGHGVVEFRETLLSACASHESLGEPVPRVLMTLEKTLNLARDKMLRDGGMPALTVARFVEFALANTAIENGDEALRHASLLHRVGSIVYLDGTNLVILEPNWLLSVYRTLVSLQHRWISTDGVLERSNLRRIWRDFPTTFFPSLLHCLRSFDLIVPLASSQKSTQHDNLDEAEHWLVPARLSTTEPSNVLKKFITVVPGGAIFVRRLTFDYLPRSFFGRLLSRLLHPRVCRPCMQWAGGAVLISADSRHAAMLHVNYATRQMMVRVRGARDGAKRFVVRIQDALTTLAADWYQLEWRSAVVCVHCLACRVAVPTLFDVDRLAQMVVAAETHVVCFNGENNAPVATSSTSPLVSTPGVTTLRRSGIAVAVNRASLRASVTLDHSPQRQRDSMLLRSGVHNELDSPPPTPAQEAESLRIDIGALKPVDVVDVRDMPLPATPSESSSIDETTTPGVAVRLDELVPDVTLASVPHVEFSSLDVLRQVGRGAYAVVHEALIGESLGGTIRKRRISARRVAVKQLVLTNTPQKKNGNNNDEISPVVDDAQDAQRVVEAATQFRKVFDEFRREAWLLSSLEHPNIVNFFGVVVDPLCLLFEYVPHGDLFTMLHDESIDIDWPMRLRIALDVSDAMSYLHSMRPPVIHRDLKSPNVLLADTSASGDVVAKVADFGLSSYMSSSVIGRAVDNPTWCAPETLRGGEHGCASDVYSFGVILWELLSRDTFFGSFKFMHMVEDQVLAGKRPAIPTLANSPFTSTYVRLVQRCWHQQPTMRPTFDAVCAELGSISPFSSRGATVRLTLRNTGSSSSLGAMSTASSEGRRPAALLVDSTDCE